MMKPENLCRETGVVRIIIKQSAPKGCVYMPMRAYLILLSGVFFLFCSVKAEAQRQDSLKEMISFYSDVMVNADDAAHRLKAHDIFRSSLIAFLELPGSDTLTLDSIPWISELHGDDFRMITWQLRRSNEEYVYGGFVQQAEKITELKDTRPWLNGSLRNTYNPAAWYGALYYEIIPFDCNDQTHYILFGFNAENSLVNTKVVDVLDLSGDRITFGKAVFTKGEDQQTRLMLTYADASSVQVFFDPALKAIVHDHLENLPGVGPSGEVLAVSDGSQEGWFFRNGQWVYQENVYDLKSETPPMLEERKERKEDKDLFGRPKKE